MLLHFIDDCSQYLEEMKHIPESISHYSGMVEPYHKLYWELSADFGYSYIHMCMDWARKSIKKLEELT